MRTVTFNLIDFTNNPWAIKNIKITPTGSIIGTSGSYLIPNDPKTKTTDSTGAFVTDLVDGLYKCEAIGPTTTTFWLYSTGSGTSSAKDLLVSQSIAYQILGNPFTASYAFSSSYYNGDGYTGTIMFRDSIPLQHTMSFTRGIMTQYINS